MRFFLLTNFFSFQTRVRFENKFINAFTHIEEEEEEDDDEIFFRLYALKILKSLFIGNGKFVESRQ